MYQPYHPTANIAKTLTSVRKQKGWRPLRVCRTRLQLFAHMRKEHNESCDYSFPAVTWEHVQVVVQVVGAAQEAEQEDKSVGGPGDGPEQEQ